MAKLAEVGEQLDLLEIDLAQAYDRIEQGTDLLTLKIQLAEIEDLSRQVHALAQEISTQLPQLEENEWPQASVLLLRLKSLIESNLAKAEQHKEIAKQGVLSLRQTSSGAAAYHAIKKQR